MFAEKIKKMGYSLENPPKPVASYEPAIKTGNLLYISGQLPFIEGELKYKGKLDKDLTIEEGQEASRVCFANALAVAKDYLGDLERINRVIKITGYVNSLPQFIDQAKVVNGASDMLAEVFGERGKHARVAVGVASLPLDAAVELEVIIETKE